MEAVLSELEELYTDITLCESIGNFFSNFSLNFLFVSSFYLLL